MNVQLNPEAAFVPQMPLREGPDVSFVPFARAGDDQGEHGACAVFAGINHIEIMRGRRFTDQRCLELYFALDDEYNGGSRGGLRIVDMFAGLQAQGFFDATARIRVASSLARLAEQPLIAVYEINAGWYSPNAAGNILESNRDETGHYHAVLIDGHGHVSAVAERILWIENSWGLGHGYKGHMCFTEDYHNAMCREMYYIEEGAGK